MNQDPKKDNHDQPNSEANKELRKALSNNEKLMQTNQQLRVIVLALEKIFNDLKRQQHEEFAKGVGAGIGGLILLVMLLVATDPDTKESRARRKEQAAIPTRREDHHSTSFYDGQDPLTDLLEGKDRGI